MMARQPRMALPLIVVHVMLVPTLTAQTGGYQFWDIGEGYTAERAGGQMQVSWRMFSAPDPVCEDVPSDIDLSAPAGPTTLVVGEPFDMDALGVVATDQTGMLASRVPITVQVRDQTRPRLNVERFRMGLGLVVPVGRGILTFRVRAICSETPAEVLVFVRVREQ